jgi:hypothetical protein
MTNELESMSYFIIVNLQWEHESCSSVEYDKPQFEQITIFSMHSTKKSQIKTSQTSIMEIKLLVYVKKNSWYILNLLH